MPSDFHFPPELLKATAAEKLAYFESCTVVHRRLKIAYEAFLDAVNNPGGASLIFLFGPTGVGKTTLLYQIVKVLTEENQAAMELDLGYIPIATVEARAPESGSFDWKDYYKNVLAALGDPFVDYKLRTGSSRVDGNGRQQRLVKSKANLSDLREDVEYIIKQRRLMVFLVDEAQRFTKMASGRRQQDQMDAIQSMASFTTTLHGLFGTYELLQFRNLSGQLSRRSMDIHFPRYQADCPQDMKDFKRVLKSFACQMPLLEIPDLEQYWEYFYERSIGCVGIVKDWLTQAFRKALSEQASTLSLTQITPYAPSVSKCMQMLTEAIEGENTLLEDESELIRLRQKLGLTTIKATAGELLNSSQVNNTISGKKRKRRPGERNPQRDEIGGAESAC